MKFELQNKASNNISERISHQMHQTEEITEASFQFREGLAGMSGTCPAITMPEALGW
jgi:hypothetical protein